MDSQYAQSLHDFKKVIIKSIEDIKLTSLMDGIPHQHNIPLATYAPWAQNQEFLRIYTSIQNHTLVDIYRCYELWSLCNQLKDIPGDIIEVGVWRGGTGAILATAGSGESKVFLCDTFQGVVKAGQEDTLYKGGEHSDTTIEIVEQLLLELKLEAEICKGVFPEDMVDLFKHSIIKFCHIDVDTYSSAKEVFEFIWPRMASGGIVVFDDYGFWGCEGITVYFNSLTIEKSIKIHNLNGHGIILKV